MSWLDSDEAEKGGTVCIAAGRQAGQNRRASAAEEGLAEDAPVWEHLMMGQGDDHDSWRKKEGRIKGTGSTGRGVENSQRHLGARRSWQGAAALWRRAQKSHTLGGDGDGNRRRCHCCWQLRHHSPEPHTHSVSESESLSQRSHCTVHGPP